MIVMLIMLIIIVFMILCIMILFEVMYDYKPRFEDYHTRVKNNEYLIRIMINIVALGKKCFFVLSYIFKFMDMYYYVYNYYVFCRDILCER
jgi:heme/copper-type cytochrome/quinol oxidase subunit 2